MSILTNKGKDLLIKGKQLGHKKQTGNARGLKEG